jgi:hypothetical protein
MAVFAGDEVDWSRIDYATIADDGLACVDLQQVDDCRSWLHRRGYRIVTVDCASGLTALYKQLSDVLDWQGQFGYEFQGRSLDALRDGFEFDIADDGGVVLVLLRPDAVWDGERGFVAGLLAIASEHTRRQMAEGKRFFTILVVEGGSRMLGATIEPCRCPRCGGARVPGARSETHNLPISDRLAALEIVSLNGTTNLPKSSVAHSIDIHDAVCSRYNLRPNGDSEGNQSVPSSLSASCE